MLELKDRALREERVQVLGIQLDRRQRDSRLDAALKLDELDLKVYGGRKVRLILAKLSKLGDFSRIRATEGRLSFWHWPDFSRATGGVMVN
jgi:hypothetical protein